MDICCRHGNSLEFILPYCLKSYIFGKILLTSIGKIYLWNSIQRFFIASMESTLEMEDNHQLIGVSYISFYCCKQSSTKLLYEALQYIEDNSKVEYREVLDVHTLLKRHYSRNFFKCKSCIIMFSSLVFKLNLYLFITIQVCSFW